MKDTRRGTWRFAALVVTASAIAGQYGCSSGSTGTSNDDEGSQGSDAATPGATGDAASPNGDDGTAPVDAGHMVSTHDAGAMADAHEGSPDASQGGSVDAATAGDASADESAWLDPMNAARAAVMANEPPLTWNPIAAQVALNYAMQCNYLHNPNRDSDYKTLGGGNGGLGENIAAGAPSIDIAGATGDWIGEDAYYDYATNTCNTGGNDTIECGHYTQIVWKTTTSVGCAIVMCNTNSPFAAKYGTAWTFAVCDYSPPGNLVPQGSTTTERPY